MNPTIVQNTMKFLERAQVSGIESFAWCECYAALKQMLETMTTPQKAQSE